MPVPPIYQPEIPAEAVYWAAHHRRRELWVGYSAVQAILGTKLAPSFLVDRYLALTGFSGQQVEGMPVDGEREGNLFEPVQREAATHGIFDEQAKTRSPQLWAATHRPLLGGAVAAAAAVGAAARSRASVDERSPPRRHCGATRPHVLREYALLADGERGHSRRAARRLRLDVLSRAGTRTPLLLADRRLGEPTRSRRPNAMSGAATTSRGA